MMEPEPRLPVRLRPVKDSVAFTPVHAAIGLAALATDVAASVTRRLSWVAVPLGRTLLYPSLLPERLHPARALEALASRGRGSLRSAGEDLERLVAAIVPVVVVQMLDTLDLTAIVRDRVDLDRVVADVDIEAAIRRVDLNAVVRRVDVDAVVADVDIEAVVKRIDIDAIAERIDLDRVVARLDVDAIVARVDLAAVVDRINVVAIAEEVIREIDLPEIIRDSTGSVASEVVRGARMQSVDADEAISRFVDRWLRRRSRRINDASVEPRDLVEPVQDNEPLP